MTLWTSAIKGEGVDSSLTLRSARVLVQGPQFNAPPYVNNGRYYGHWPNAYNAHSPYPQRVGYVVAAAPGLLYPVKLCQCGELPGSMCRLQHYLCCPVLGPKVCCTVSLLCSLKFYRAVKCAIKPATAAEPAKGSGASTDINFQKRSQLEEEVSSFGTSGRAA